MPLLASRGKENLVTKVTGSAKKAPRRYFTSTFRSNTVNLAGWLDSGIANYSSRSSSSILLTFVVYIFYSTYVNVL